MTTRKVLIFFVVFLLLNIFISYHAGIIPYKGNFPYQENFQYSPLPQFLNAFANFDGMMYVRIAHQNYSQYEQAFFPVYPLLIRFITASSYTNYYLLVGLTISIFYFLIGILVFNKYIGEILESKIKREWTIVFLLLFPTSFFFQTVYTESVLFFFTISTFYFIYKKNYVLAGLCAYVAALTKFMGIFLFIPFLIPVLIEVYGSIKNNNFLPTMRKNLLIILASFTPILGFSTYAFYLWKTTNDPFFFFNSQPAFGANRSTHLIFLPQVIYRYIKIFFTSQINFQLFIAITEFTIFLMVFGILLWEFKKIFEIKNKEVFLSRLSLNLFSLVNIILPTLTGTFSSIPRYAVLSLSFFLALAEIRNIYLKICIAVLFLILHVILLGYFIQGYFIS